MIRLFTFFSACLVLLFASARLTVNVQAQSTDPSFPEYQRAKIEAIETTPVAPPSGVSEIQSSQAIQTVTFRLFSDQSTHTIQYGSEFQPLTEKQLLETGQVIIVTEAESTAGLLPEDSRFQIIDTFRLQTWSYLLLFFVILVFAVARIRGLLSVGGMTITIFVLSLVLVPAFLQGYDPLLVSILGAVGLSAITLYITHGWNWGTHIAYVSIVSVLVLVGFLSYGTVQSMQLTGLGSEEALFIQFLAGQEIQLQGLLLGGILLSTLGVLDDIIVSQIAVVRELFESKPHIQFGELFQRSLRVGQTHVASLVNTLVLVYAGSNLPLFLLFANAEQPLWVTLNSELIMEEMIRTLSGSIGLVTAVPISTFLAAATLLILPKVLDRSIDFPSHHHFHTHSHDEPHPNKTHTH